MSCILYIAGVTFYNDLICTICAYESFIVVEVVVVIVVVTDATAVVVVAAAAAVGRLIRELSVYLYTLRWLRFSQLVNSSERFYYFLT